MAKDKTKPDPNDPSNTSAAWRTMQPKWKLIQTLLNGTAAMREASTDYLPQHDNEPTDGYLERLACTTLYNVTELTLNALVGRPFSDAVRTNDVPPEVAALLPNIDLQGGDLHNFCRKWMSEAIAKGFAHCLIDMPSISDEERATRTLLDDAKQNMRPFWKLISPENVIAAYTEVVNGVERYTHVRILECEIERQQFLEVEQQYICVLEPGLWWRYKRVEDPTTKDITWPLYDSGTTPLDFIPLVTAYAARDGVCSAKPPLEDLAYMNVAHWQSTSDQRNILTVSRFPMLAVAGAHELGSDTMTIGPRQLLGTRDPSGRFYYVEHSGKAIEAGERDLAILEDTMANYGAEFLKKKKVASRNPQDRIYDVTEETSGLQDIVKTFSASANLALAYTAVFTKSALVNGLPFGGTVVINDDFTVQDSNANDLQHLAQARVNGDISLETYLETLKRLNTLDPTLDVTEEIARIEKENTENDARDLKKASDLAEMNAKFAPKPAAGATGATGPGKGNHDAPALPPRGTKK